MSFSKKFLSKYFCSLSWSTVDVIFSAYKYRVYWFFAFYYKEVTDYGFYTDRIVFLNILSE